MSDKTLIPSGVNDGKTTTQFSPATQKWGYRARVLVPVELQGKIGKKVLYTSVWQASETEAANLAWPQVQKFEALLERVRSEKFYPATEMEARGAAMASRADVRCLRDAHRSQRDHLHRSDRRMGAEEADR